MAREYCEVDSYSATSRIQSRTIFLQDLFIYWFAAIHIIGIQDQQLGTIVGVSSLKLSIRSDEPFRERVQPQVAHVVRERVVHLDVHGSDCAIGEGVILC